MARFHRILIVWHCGFKVTFPIRIGARKFDCVCFFAANTHTLNVCSQNECPTKKKNTSICSVLYITSVRIIAYQHINISICIGSEHTDWKRSAEASTYANTQNVRAQKETIR